MLCLSVLTEWPYVECVLWVPVAQSPMSPEWSAPGASPVWVVCALLLQLSLVAVGMSVGGFDPEASYL